MSEPVNAPSRSQSTTNMAEEIATPKIQEPGNSIPSAAYQPIPPKNLGIKVRAQPDNEDDIDIKSVPMYKSLVSIIILTGSSKF